MRQAIGFSDCARKPLFPLFCLVVVVVVTGPNTVDAGDEKNKTDSDEAVRALASAFVANRDSFQQIECAFELRQFRIESEEDAFNGRVTPEAVARGSFIRDGAKLRQEVDVPDVEVEAAVKRGSIVFDPKCLLLDGERGIYYSKDITGAVLYSPAHPAENTLLGPFSCGRFFGGGGPQPETILDGPFAGFAVRLISEPVADEPHAAVPMRELVGFEYTSKSGNLRIQFFIAPAHGHLPIVCRQYFKGVPEKNFQGGLAQKSVTTDLRHFDQQRVFPMRNINVHYRPDKPDIAAFAVETRVTDIKVGQPVDPTVFQIGVKANSVLRDGADDNSQFLLTKPR